VADFTVKFVHSHIFISDHGFHCRHGSIRAESRR
jgi:hypothetical protein